MPWRSAFFICVSAVEPGVIVYQVAFVVRSVADEVEAPAPWRVGGVQHGDLAGDLRVRNVAVRDARALVDDVEVDVDRSRR